MAEYIKFEFDIDKMWERTCKVSSIAAATSSKKSNPDAVLPDIPLIADEIWAFVDLGSTRNAAAFSQVCLAQNRLNAADACRWCYNGQRT